MSLLSEKSSDACLRGNHLGETQEHAYGADKVRTITGLKLDLETQYPFQQ